MYINIWKNNLKKMNESKYADTPIDLIIQIHNDSRHRQ